MRKRISVISYVTIISVITVALFSGCISSNRSPSNQTSTDQSLTFDGRIRTYRVHLPSGYNNSDQYPLVIVLHGGMGDTMNIEQSTKMSNKADEEDFIVVYPNGTASLLNMLTWNAGFCCGYAYANDVDDVGFIRALIEQLENNLSIDSHRIYVTGFSNGAMLTYRLGAELSDIVAAIAPVSGSIGGYATRNSPLWTIPEPDYPVPVIAFHGMADTIVPYNGGEPTTELGAFSYLSVNDSISFWVNHNTCSTIPQVNVSESGNIIVDTYTATINNADVVLYTVVNGEHRWPGGPGGTQEISATDIIWDFFNDHPKQ
jgi:polyhydroxybutyrate depolymerase